MHILIVCSGNTCRSPLAAAMLRDALARDATWDDVTVSSAGTSAWDGSPASEGAYLVALERGLDLSNHRARMLTTSEVARADLILTVSEAHSRRVADLGGATKVHTLAGFANADVANAEIPDPYGGEVAHYRETAELIASLLPAITARLGRERRR
jgi:protein-tyrosine phosphatase